MSIKSSALFVLAVLVVLACAPAQAVTNVVVRPDGDRIDNAWNGFEQPCTNGWSINCYCYGWGQLSTFGPSTYQNTNRPENQCVGTLFPGGGEGAYYASCDYFQGTGSDVNPSTSWLGTDQWNGVDVAGKRLGDITAMDYFAFISKTPQRWAGLKAGGEVEYWSKNGWWNSWQQPITLEFTAQALNPNTGEVEQRQFWYRPDGGNFVGDDGMRNKGIWLHWNGLTWGKWYSPQYDSSARGYEFGVYPETGKSSWAAMMDKSVADVLAGAEYASTVPFKDWTLSPTSSIWKSPGWKGGANPAGHPNATGTGKPVNFRAGARHQKPMTMYCNGKILVATDLTTTLTAQVEIGATVVYAVTTGFPNSGTARIDGDDFTYTGRLSNRFTGCTEIEVQHLVGAQIVQTVLQGANTMWPNESYGYRGQVDMFTLGFNGTSVCYDFEPAVGAAPPKIVATVAKSLGVQTPENYLNLAPIVQGAYLFNPVSGGPDTRTVCTGSTGTFVNEEMAQKLFLFKVCGKVTVARQGSWDNNFKQYQNSYFTIEDGTGLMYTDTGVVPGELRDAPVWVFMAPRIDPLNIWPGDYVSAYGYVEPMRWKNVGTPLIMWSNPDHVTQLVSP